MAQLRTAHRLEVEPYGAHLRDQAVEVLDGWMRDKRKAPGDADDAACRDALSLAPELRLDGFIHWADGQPAGFLLAEDRLVDKSPTAIRRGKYAMRAISAMSFDQAIAYTESQIAVMLMTEDAREGMAAFNEKRKPVWTGR